MNNEEIKQLASHCAKGYAVCVDDHLEIDEYIEKLPGLREMKVGDLLDIINNQLHVAAVQINNADDVFFLNKEEYEKFKKLYKKILRSERIRKRNRDKNILLEAKDKLKKAYHEDHEKVIYKDVNHGNICLSTGWEWATVNGVIIDVQPQGNDLIGKWAPNAIEILESK